MMELIDTLRSMRSLDSGLNHLETSYISSHHERHLASVSSMLPGKIIPTAKQYQNSATVDTPESLERPNTLYYDTLLRHIKKCTEQVNSVAMRTSQGDRDINLKLREVIRKQDAFTIALQKMEQDIRI
jgi:hypothetical protein